MAKSPLAESQSSGGVTSTSTQEKGALDDLLAGSWKPADLERDPGIKQGVEALIRRALELSGTNLISDDVLSTIKNLKAELDKRLTKQLNAVMHHEEFLKLEASWRGLHTLVMNSELNKDLKIRVMNISKDELGKTLGKFEGATWDKSPLYKKIYQEEFGMPGGEPYGCIIGDFAFTHAGPDIKLLQGMGRISAAAHAPFITAAAPGLLKLDSWTELPNLNDVSKRFQLDEYRAWRSLRANEDSQYIGIAFPHFMARTPYGPDNPSDGFVFEESTPKHEDYVWANGAYAMGLNISAAFTRNGWTCAIRGVDSGGRVEGLPCAKFETDDGSVAVKCPTEVGINMGLELELARNGFMPLSHFKNTDYAAFIGAQSLHEPKVFNKADATGNAALSARLPYIFAASRFAHFLKKMVYRKVGSNMEREDVEQWLNNWISDYVLTNTKDASEEQKAEKPLAEARVVVAEVEGNPGAYAAKFFLRPHYQLESIDVSLSLVTKVPKPKS